MRLSKKTDYALRAVFTLAEEHGREPISIRALAHRNRIPKRFLEHIMLDMKAKGWVDSLPGKNGGYVLKRSPGAISMGEIVRHFGGLLAPVGCVSTSAYEACTQESVCRFRRVLLNARNYVAALMDRSTLESVMRGQVVTRSEVFEAFVQGAGI